MRGKIRSGILGFAVADALGVPVEFCSREKLQKHKVTGMNGFGTYGQPKGTWSDDTSMTLATMDSLVNGLKLDNMMKCFMNWMEKGDYTPFGECFDIGNTTKRALLQFRKGKRPWECGGTGKNDNGNGSLMRMLPLSYYLIGKDGYMADDQAMLNVVHQVSALTHRHIRSKMACGIYVMIAITLLKEGNLSYAIHQGIRRAVACYRTNKATKEELRFFKRLYKNKIEELTESEIKSTGYVIDTLEAAIWCLLNTNSYQECVLKAVNLGEDTDTIAAVAGGLAGIAYGVSGIPPEWLDALERREYIEELCDRFSDAVYKESVQLLLPYEEFLRTATRESCCTPDSAEKEKIVYAFAYPEYVEEVNAFIKTVENSCFWSYHYVAILSEQGVELSEGIEEINTADWHLLCAILTAYIRQERFQEGLIATAIEEKVFFNIIERMKELCEVEKGSMSWAKTVNTRNIIDKR